MYGLFPCVPVPLCSVGAGRAADPCSGESGPGGTGECSWACGGRVVREGGVPHRAGSEHGFATRCWSSGRWVGATRGRGRGGASARVPRSVPLRIPRQSRGSRALKARGLLSSPLAHPSPTPPPRPCKPAPHQPRRMACADPLGSALRARARLAPGHTGRSPPRPRPRVAPTQRPLLQQRVAKPCSDPALWGTPPSRTTRPPQAHEHSPVPPGPDSPLQGSAARPAPTEHRGTGTQGNRPYIFPSPTTPLRRFSHRK